MRDFSEDLDDRNVFIHVADDSTATVGSAPELKGDEKTLPVLQYEMIADHPYRYSEPDIAFETFADHKHISAADRPMERKKFFSKGQPCLRASALAKRYGWGFHKDAAGKVAMYAVDSKEYERFAHDAGLKHVMAMRSRRA